MKNILALAIVCILFSCSNTDDPPADEPISDDPVTGTVDGMPWDLARSNGNYNFSDNGLGNKVEKITIVLSRKDSFDYCVWPVDLDPGAYAIATILPQLGEQKVGLNSTETFFSIANLSYPQSGFAEFFIEELDTTGEGRVKGKMRYRNSLQSSPANPLEGSFDATLCRDIRKTEFKDQQLQGYFGDRNWTLISGQGYGQCGTNRMYFYDYQRDHINCQSPDTVPALIVEILSSKIRAGTYSTGTNPVTVNFYSVRDAGNWFPLAHAGIIQIDTVDLTQNRIKGKIDCFDPFRPYYFNGNFDIPFYE